MSAPLPTDGVIVTEAGGGGAAAALADRVSSVVLDDAVPHA
jgi:hypothetical protein